MNQTTVSDVVDLGEWERHLPAAGRRTAWERREAARRRFGEIILQHLENPGIRTASWRLCPVERSVAKARRLTRARLVDWGMDGLSETVELLVSELVTNALRHAGGPVRLTLTTVEGLLRCEVADSGTVLPRLQQVTDDDESGRGLSLLDMLSCCWGGVLTETGKVMWFELPGCAACSADAASGD
jgi:anti-sigma regulatory factor (Ser/Thr protein kinase)